MRAVTLERSTRRLVGIWTTASAASATAAMTVALAAGGNSEWSRWLLGAFAIGGMVAATRFRVSLHIGVVSGALMLAVVPHDASLDRGVVAAIGAVLILLAAEAAHVARRLVTIAPVRSTSLDALAVARLAVAATGATGVTALVAQLDHWGTRLFVVGAALSGAALVMLLDSSAETDPSI